MWFVIVEFIIQELKITLLKAFKQKETKDLLEKANEKAAKGLLEIPTNLSNFETLH